jgi:hypothetical protein
MGRASARNVDGCAVAPMPEAVTLPAGAEMGIVPIEHTGIRRNQ